MTFNGKPISPAVVNISTVTDHTIVAAASGQKIYVFAMWLWANGTVTVTPKSGSTSLSGAIAMVAQNKLEFAFNDAQEPWFVTAAGEAFVLTLAQAIQVSGRVYYVQTV